jgi:Family of unknown function (DUF6220)
MAQQTPSSPAPRPAMVTAFRSTAIVTVVVVAVQFFLAGLGAFDAVHSGAAAQDTSAYDPHKTVGYAIAVLSLLLLILAIVGRLGGQLIGMTATLLILAGPIQPLLAGAGEDAVFWGALHAFVGAAILGLTGNLITIANRIGR